MAIDLTSRPTPKTVCIVTNSRNQVEAADAVQEETLMGRIVLTTGVFPEALGSLNESQERRVAKLDLSKIEAADELLVVNPDKYVNNAGEFFVLYAEWAGKTVRFSHTKACDNCGEQKLREEIAYDDHAGAMCKDCTAPLDDTTTN